MDSQRYRYSMILEAVEETPDPSEVAVIATSFGFRHDPYFGPWFRDAILSRYPEFTQPGWPDGPPYQRPYGLQ
jgi:hypothetical protein